MTLSLSSVKPQRTCEEIKRKVGGTREALRYKSDQISSFLRAMRLSRPVLGHRFQALSFEKGPRLWFGLL